MKKTLLLDFDGVILKNKNIERKIITRIERYCGDQLKIKNKKLFKKVNCDLYNYKGHTLLGLKEIGIPKSLKDFNDKIYDVNYDELYQNITIDNIADIKKIIEINDFCNNNNINIKIWSNSPRYWCKKFINNMTEELRDIEIINNYDCSYLLKPEKESYQYIESLVKSDIIFFVDDKLSNFCNIYNNEKWINIYLTEKYFEKMNDKMWVINDLSYIKNILMAYF